MERHRGRFLVGHSPELAEEMERLIAGELFDETVELRTVAAHLVNLLAVVVHVHAAHVNVAGGVLYVARQHLERGRLAGTVRPQQTETLVGLQRQVQSPHRFLVAVLLPDVAVRSTENTALLKVKKNLSLFTPDETTRSNSVRNYYRVSERREYSNI